MKKFISLILALLLLVGIVPINAFADEIPYFIAENWEDLVKFLDKLEDGEKVRIGVAPARYGADTFYARYDTACISADDVEITFDDQMCFFIHHEVDEPFTDAIFEVTGNNVTLDFSGSKLQSRGDSAIIVDGDRCTIKNAYFFYCENPDGKGGAIRITDNDPYCHIINCQFRGCYAKDGGAIYIDADDALIEDCTFSECNSKNNEKHGGADAYDNEGESIVKNCLTSNTKIGWVFVNFEEIQNVNYASWLGSTISEGNIWIIVGIGVCAGAAIAVAIVKKKKKPAFAEGEVAVADNTEKTEE